MIGGLSLHGARLWRIALMIGLATALAACGHHHLGGDDPGLNAYPATYKTDILGGMHAYLNDPTGIRDAAIAEPAIKTVGGETRYVVCVQFNGKMNANGAYAGVKTYAAVFLAGHFDHFVEKAEETCAGATYAPFPELQALPR